MTNLPSRTTAGVRPGCWESNYIYHVQTEYFCDTSPAPAQADNFGDYIIIPGRVFSIVLYFIMIIPLYSRRSGLLHCCRGGLLCQHSRESRPHGEQPQQEKCPHHIQVSSGLSPVSWSLYLLGSVELNCPASLLAVQLRLSGMSVSVLIFLSLFLKQSGSLHRWSGPQR